MLLLIRPDWSINKIGWRVITYTDCLFRILVIFLEGGAGLFCSLHAFLLKEYSLLVFGQQLLTQGLNEFLMGGEPLLADGL